MSKTKHVYARYITNGILYWQYPVKPTNNLYLTQLKSTQPLDLLEIYEVKKQEVYLNNLNQTSTKKPNFRAVSDVPVL